MGLSKSEAKFRNKFIAEYNYSKEEQRIFDNAIKESIMTYKEVYKSVKNGYRYSFMFLIAANRASAAMKAVATSFAEATIAIKNLTCHLEEFINEYVRKI